MCKLITRFFQAVLVVAFAWNFCLASGIATFQKKVDINRDGKADLVKLDSYLRPGARQLTYELKVVVNDHATWSQIILSHQGFYVCSDGRIIIFDPNGQSVEKSATFHYVGFVYAYNSDTNTIEKGQWISSTRSFKDVSNSSSPLVEHPETMTAIALDILENLRQREMPVIASTIEAAVRKYCQGPNSPGQKWTRFFDKRVIGNWASLRVAYPDDPRGEIFLLKKVSKGWWVISEYHENYLSRREVQELGIPEETFKALGFQIVN